MKISIIGAGYVGLVTGAVYADFGHKVFCVEIDKKKVEDLKKAKIPFYEPGLDELVEKNLKTGRLRFTTSYSESITTSRVVFVCVGTPPQDDGDVDLSYLFKACEETAKHLNGYTLIAIKSTVPVGVEEKLEEIIRKNSKAKFEFASVPEFLREGSAISDTLRPDRIVIGAKTKKAVDIILDLHKHVSGERLVCDLRSAQLVKYAANSFLATKVSFSNAVTQFSEKVGADAEKVLEGVGLDKRIGHNYLDPGVGYGGSCLPKDVAAFIKIAQRAGYDFTLLRAVEDINLGQIEGFIQSIKKAVGDLKGVIIGVLGLSFKPDTDDIREAPSLKIIQKLIDLGAKVRAYDPVAMENCKKVFGKKVEFCKDSYDTAKRASALLIITEWNEFRELDLEKIKKLMKRPVILDGRNLYDPEKVKSLSFYYKGVGR